MKLTLALVVSLAVAGCAAKPAPVTTPPPAEETTYEEPAYVEPAYTEETPTELPGTYVEGLGNPVITVLNHLDTALSLQITDGSGYSYDYYLEAGQQQDVVLYPGEFSFTAYAGENSLNGVHAAEIDNAYEWEFSFE